MSSNAASSLTTRPASLPSHAPGSRARTHQRLSVIGEHAPFALPLQSATLNGVYSRGSLDDLSAALDVDRGIS